MSSGYVIPPSVSTSVPNGYGINTIALCELATMDGRQQYILLKSTYAAIIDNIEKLNPALHRDMQDALETAYRTSPICGDGVGRVSFNRITLKALKEYLPTEVLFRLVSSGVDLVGSKQSFADTLMAIISPASRGVNSTEVSGRQSSTGYALGCSNRCCNSDTYQSVFPAISESNCSRHRDAINNYEVFDIEAFVGDLHRVREAAHDINATNVTLTGDTDTTSATATSNHKDNTNMNITTVIDAVIYATATAIEVEAENAMADYGTTAEFDKDDIKTIADAAITAITAGMDTGQAAAIAGGVQLYIEGFDADAIRGKSAGVSPEAKAIAKEKLPNLFEEGGEAAEAAVIKVDEVSINPTYATMIDAVFKDATGGKFNTISEMTAQMNRVMVENAQMQGVVTDLRKKVAGRPAASNLPPAEINGIVSTVSMVSAGTLFKTPTGRPMSTKIMGFEVPLFEHKDASGNVVVHPLVPEADDAYVWRPALLAKTLAAIVNGDNLWLYGHTGTGKSTHIEQVCARLNYPMRRVNLDSNIERADLTGEKELVQVNGATVTEFKDGVLPQAMSGPCVLLLDEIDFGRPDVLYVIQRALEGKGLLLTEDKGRLIVPHPMFRFVATANTKGQGDEFGLYQGARTLSTATLDRFSVWVQVDYLEEKEETELITGMFPGTPPATCAEFVRYAKEVRTGFLNGDLSTTVSPRGLMSMVRYNEFFGKMTGSTNAGKKASLDMAIQMAALDRVPADNRQAMLEIAKRVFS
jgi:cobaltochelatase CobS